MYKHGKPIHKLTKRPLLTTMAVLILVLAGGLYYIVMAAGKDSVSGSNQARVTVIKDKAANNTSVSEDLFSMMLPGPWKLSAQDWDARYHAYQWDSQDTKLAGRWFRVYVDTIPKDQAVNYLLPVKLEGNNMAFGRLSDNCVNFTQGAVPQEKRPVFIPLNQANLPSRWELVDFLCDNANVNQQVVAAAAGDALNTVTLHGPNKGTHKYFFMYRDNNISPDYGTMEKILATFTVK
jgi:hypothetical protein